ncbi:MAG: alanine dehydrogenase [Caulobacterales bacterium]
MRIGCLTEIKLDEHRVGLTPESAAELVRARHSVAIQQGAGLGIGASDDRYREAGAHVLETAQKVFEDAELVIKVKEPQLSECAMLRPGQTLFTYLHLAPDPDQARALLRSGARAIAYETVTDAQGRLPLLKPMSEVAGRMAIQVGASFLEKGRGGRGVLLGGVPGVPPGNVVILGAGVAGYNAAQIAVGMRARVAVFDTNVARLEALDREFSGRIETIYSTQAALDAAIMEADLVVGAVLIPGANAPKLVTKAMLRAMRPGAVLVDVSIDQGGCFETSRPTTHRDPVFMVDGIIHYCVANMPGAVARTSAYALNHATLPFILALANHGPSPAMANDPHLAAGLNVEDGQITHPTVAEALGFSS